MISITEERIIRKLSRSNGGVDPGGAERVKAAVLIPLFREKGEWKILFTRRSQSVQDHKGQVSFPGGAFEWIDRDLEATALRETEEEIGIPSQKVRILGRMAPFPSISNYLITPVVGVIEFPFQIKAAIEEVDRVFAVPLDWLADKAHYQERDYLRSNGKNEKVLFYEEVEGELIWGITARILTRFLNLMMEES